MHSVLLRKDILMTPFLDIFGMALKGGRLALLGARRPPRCTSVGVIAHAGYDFHDLREQKQDCYEIHGRSPLLRKNFLAVNAGCLRFHACVDRLGVRRELTPRRINLQIDRDVK